MLSLNCNYNEYYKCFYNQILTLLVKGLVLNIKVIEILAYQNLVLVYIKLLTDLESLSN